MSELQAQGNYIAQATNGSTANVIITGKQNKTWFWGGIGVIITLIITVAITIYSNSGKQNTSPSTIKNNNINVSGNNNNTFNDLKSISGDVNIITGNTQFTKLDEKARTEKKQ